MELDWNVIEIDELRERVKKAEAERDEALERNRKLSAEWQSLPDSQGDWWHWDGHPGHYPFVHGVMVSKTGPDRYFIQHPDGRWCDEVGGIWCRINLPPMPNKSEFDAIIAALQQNADQEMSAE